MNRKISFVLLAVVTAVILGVPTRSHALTFVSAGGTSCQPQNPNIIPNSNPPEDYDSIQHLINGAANPSTTREGVFLCPLNATLPAARNVTAVGVNYQDFSQFDAFYCIVYQNYNSGSIYYTVPKYTCATGGGCNTQTTQNTFFVGHNYIQWSCSDLGSNLCAQQIDSNYGILCGVPKNTGNASFVISMYSY
jgi:hypothetical protein